MYKKILQLSNHKNVDAKQVFLLFWGNIITNISTSNPKNACLNIINHPICSEIEPTSVTDKWVKIISILVKNLLFLNLNPRGFRPRVVKKV